MDINQVLANEIRAILKGGKVKMSVGTLADLCSERLSDSDATEPEAKPDQAEQKRCINDWTQAVGSYHVVQDWTAI